ncbi:MAG: 50S ribosomal protein L37ae [archaeon]
MASKTKKIKAFGKYRTSAGVSVRNNYNLVEATQRKVQKSPFHPTGKAKRIAAGIWRCVKTGKVFAGGAYAVDA